MGAATLGKLLKLTTNPRFLSNLFIFFNKLLLIVFYRLIFLFISDYWNICEREGE